MLQLGIVSELELLVEADYLLSPADSLLPLITQFFNHYLRTLSVPDKLTGFLTVVLHEKGKGIRAEKLSSKICFVQTFPIEILKPSERYWV